MKDPKDKYTLDMYEQVIPARHNDIMDDNVYNDNEATEERLDKQVKEWLWNNQTKAFEPYPVGTVAEWIGKDHDEF